MHNEEQTLLNEPQISDNYLLARGGGYEIGLALVAMTLLGGEIKWSELRNDTGI